MAKRRALLLAATVVAALAFTYMLLSSGGGEEVSYPKSLPDGARVVSVVAGARAVEMVKSIHWHPGIVPVRDAVIVEYSDGTRLWISRVEGDGCKVLWEMVRAMERYEAELPYTAPVKHTIAGVTVYLSLDKRTGTLHAIWCRGDMVVWAELARASPETLSRLVSRVG